VEKIKILGTGCSRCSSLYEAVRTRVGELGLSVSVEKITDMAAIAQMGVMSVPAVVIDGAVVHAGGNVTDAMIDQWLTGQSKKETEERKGCCCCCSCGDKE
jgi:small redox-active disulfide protein 2